MRNITGKFLAGTVIALALLGTPAAAETQAEPPADAVLVGQFTIGGCVTVCETLAMCEDAYIDETNGDCWLTLDKTHADFAEVVKACPKPEGRRFSADIEDGIWHLSCSSAPTDEKAEEPDASAGDDMSDIAPF